MTATKTPKLSWKAQRQGDDIYCAPACGGKCKFAAFELATARARDLAARLGPTWEPIVHENLGWHYSVRSACDRIHVHEYWRRPHDDSIVEQLAVLIPDYYTAFLHPEGGGSGRWTADGETPGEAVREVVAIATAERDRLSEMLNGVVPATDELVVG